MKREIKMFEISHHKYSFNVKEKNLTNSQSNDLLFQIEDKIMQHTCGVKL